VQEYAEKYAEDQELFFKDYVLAHKKLSELGAKFDPPEVSGCFGLNACAQRASLEHAALLCLLDHVPHACSQVVAASCPLGLIWCGSLCRGVSQGVSLST
jgi:hypothetical protein